MSGNVPWYRLRARVLARQEACDFATLRSQVDADIRAQIRRTSPTPLFEDVRYALGDPGLRLLNRPSLVQALHMAALAKPLEMNR